MPIDNREYESETLRPAVSAVFSRVYEQALLESAAADEWTHMLGDSPVSERDGVGITPVFHDLGTPAIQLSLFDATQDNPSIFSGKASFSVPVQYRTQEAMAAVNAILKALFETADASALDRPHDGLREAVADRVEAETGRRDIHLYQSPANHSTDDSKTLRTVGVACLEYLCREYAPSAWTVVSDAETVFVDRSRIGFAVRIHPDGEFSWMVKDNDPSFPKSENGVKTESVDRLLKSLLTAIMTVDFAESEPVGPEDDARGLQMTDESFTAFSEMIQGAVLDSEAVTEAEYRDLPSLV